MVNGILVFALCWLGKKSDVNLTPFIGQIVLGIAEVFSLVNMILDLLNFQTGYIVNPVMLHAGS